jgi:phage terminase Nu1 subunit (DNA packaging protein)
MPPVSFLLFIFLQVEKETLPRKQMQVTALKSAMSSKGVIACGGCRVIRKRKNLMMMILRMPAEEQKRNKKTSRNRLYHSLGKNCQSNESRVARAELINDILASSSLRTSKPPVIQALLAL